MTTITHSDSDIESECYSLDQQIQPIIHNLDPYRGENLIFTTITLKPKLYKFQSITQYDLTVNDFEKYLRMHTVRTYYSVELTNDGNVHYHTISHFMNKLQKMYFINSIKKNKQLGFIKVTPAPIESQDQLKRAALYLVKDLKVTSRIICRNGYKPDLLKFIL